MNTILITLVITSISLNIGGSGHFGVPDLGFIQEPTQERLCVKYKTQNGWSKGYSVNVTIISGSELNRRTKSYRYKSYSTYGVIFWGDDQASVIELKNFFGQFTVLGTNGIDGEGREWKMNNGLICL